MILKRWMVALPLYFLLAAGIAPATAEAGWFDRMRDIYKAPEKLEEFQESYENLIRQQQQELEAVRKEAVESSRRLAEEQRKWLAENERLAEQNRSLAERLAQLEEQEQGKSAFIRNMLTVSLAIAGILIAGFLAMRIVRILIWRRERGTMRLVKAKRRS
ncbi:hypothetical protein ACFOQM_09100 [Paenibacillus sp. GCM10012307]|uniref:Uncharacterized protein n=1 Tax=Paenibacillus roseus TaxID=2798579 RepID=A0A934IY84_9BACL|nr:hypothetical protein [Paenibacillus roseus]MBJ6361442.1 hypothetical protein [Paenibacillus roseus]